MLVSKFYTSGKGMKASRASLATSRLEGRASPSPSRDYGVRDSKMSLKKPVFGLKRPTFSAKSDILSP